MGLLVCKGAVLLFAVLACSSVIRTSALYSANSDVVSLTQSNFKNKVLGANGIVLVEFFAPWCGHCKALAPAWEKAATALKGVVTIAAADCDQHQSLAQEYGVQGFPTIKAFGIGKSPVDYTGARDAKAIVDWALSQVKSIVNQRLSGKASGGGGSSGGGGGGGGGGPSASVVLTDSTFESTVGESQDTWLVEFYAPWCGHCKRLAPEWKAAAKELKGTDGVKLGQVDCTTETAIAGKYGIKGYPTILLFGADKSKPVPYEGARSTAAIVSFMKEKGETNVPVPEVLELTSQEVLDAACKSSLSCLITFVPHILDTGAAGRNSYLTILKKTAEKHKQFGYLWAEAGKQDQLEMTLGVGGYGYPALVAVNIKKTVYFPHKGSFEPEGVKHFADQTKRGGDSRSNMPFSALPDIAKTEPWDGKDGALPEEDEFSLDELMADEDSRSGEL